MEQGREGGEGKKGQRTNSKVSSKIEIKEDRKDLHNFVPQNSLAAFLLEYGRPVVCANCVFFFLDQLFGCSSCGRAVQVSMCLVTELLSELKCSVM